MCLTSHVSLSSFGLRINAARTGISVKVSRSDPAMAKLMLNAMGLNNLPSSPSSAKSGRKTTIIMRMANAIGLATSLAASKTALVLSTSSPRSLRSAMILNAFSTMTTAPSTIIPIPTASPANDIKFAERPASPIKMNAISIATGSAAMTTIAERISPRKRNRTIATRIEPSTSARTAVPTASSTKSVRSYTGRRVTPSGSD